MNKFLGKLGLAGMLAFLTANPLSAQYPDTVKIMTYNINAEGHDTGSYSDVATVIKALDPTICGLQKLDSCNKRNKRDVLKFLGEEANMSYTFAVAQPNFQGSPGSYGIGFLSKKDPKSVRRLLIPKGSASEDRAALEIGVTIAGEPVRVIVTHLDYGNATNRTAQLQKIVSWMDSAGPKTVPAVIMADFNAQSTESSMKVLTDAGFVYVKGTNGKILDTSAQQGINHILYRPEARWKVVDAGNPKYAASNRNPVWALMSLLNPVAIKTGNPGTDNHSTRPRVNAGNKEISFVLSSRATVTMRLFDPSGRLSRTFADGKTLEAGAHAFAVQGGGLPKGTYLLESTVNGLKATGKVAVVKY